MKKSSIQHRQIQFKKFPRKNVELEITFRKIDSDSPENILVFQILISKFFTFTSCRENQRTPLIFWKCWRGNYPKFISVLCDDVRCILAEKFAQCATYISQQNGSGGLAPNVGQTRRFQATVPFPIPFHLPRNFSTKCTLLLVARHGHIRTSTSARRPHRPNAISHLT